MYSYVKHQFRLGNKCLNLLTKPISLELVNLTAFPHSRRANNGDFDLRKRRLLSPDPADSRPGAHLRSSHVTRRSVVSRHSRCTLTVTVATIPLPVYAHAVLAQPCSLRALLLHELVDEGRPRAEVGPVGRRLDRQPEGEEAEADRGGAVDGDEGASPVV